MKAGLILVGGGGHCRSCIDVVEAEGKHAIAGIVDLREKIGTEISGYPILGDDDALPGLANAGNRFLITLGQIRTAAHRLRLFNLLQSIKAELVSVISPDASVSKRATVREGTIIMRHAVVNAGARVGANCIINTMALIEHDAAVGDHCHVSTGAILNGDAAVSDRVFVGSGAVVLNGVTVAADCILGAGSVVRKSIESAGTYAGNPLRRVTAS